MTGGVTLCEEEIFLSDGAKSDLGGLMDLFGPRNTALNAGPGYPVYADTSVMAGHPVRFVRGTREKRLSAHAGHTARGHCVPVQPGQPPPAPCTPGLATLGWNTPWSGTR